MARSGIAESVMLGGGSPCAVRTGCLGEGGSDAGESLVSISGAVAGGRARSAFVRVPAVLSGRFGRFGLFVRCISFPPGHPGWLEVSDVSWFDLR